MLNQGVKFEMAEARGSILRLPYTLPSKTPRVDQILPIASTANVLLPSRFRFRRILRSGVCGGPRELRLSEPAPQQSHEDSELRCNLVG
jgi:hypothetical protein